MIRWINEQLGTGAYDHVKPNDAYTVIDVRELVDKDGNSTETIRAAIDRIVASLKSNRKTVVCCDYGISRSNSLAAGAWSVFRGIPFDEALAVVVEATGEQSIKMEMIAAVRHALEGKKNGKLENILVTGAGGFIGKSLIPKLKDSVKIVPYYSAYGDLAQSGRELEALVVREEIGQIIHLANPKVYTSSVALGQSLNILKNVLDVCKQHQLKLIYPSTWEVFTGYNTTTMAVTENVSPQPRGSYGESKLLAERLLDHFIQFYHLPCLKFRICPVFGTGTDKPRFIHSFIQKALRHEEIVTHTYSNGDPHLQLLHIDDLTDFAAQAVLENLEGCYNIGGGSFLSTYEIANIIIDRLKSKSKVRKTVINDYVANIILDDQKFFCRHGYSSPVKRTFETELDTLIRLYQ